MLSRISGKDPKKYPWYLRLLFSFQRKKFGKILEPARIWGRCPQVYLGFLFMYNRLNRRKSLIDPQLQTLVTVKVSQINHCSFCVDMNSWLLMERGGSLEKLHDLPAYQESQLFTEQEKAALEYAEAVTNSTVEVEDVLFQKLLKYYNEDAIVELTALITFQNMSSMFNSALKIPSSGLCDIPK